MSSHQKTLDLDSMPVGTRHQSVSKILKGLVFSYKVGIRITRLHSLKYYHKMNLYEYYCRTLVVSWKLEDIVTLNSTMNHTNTQYFVISWNSIKIFLLPTEDDGGRSWID